MPDAVGSPDLPPLAPDEVHVWAVSPLASVRETAHLSLCLSPYERSRAAGMAHPPDRDAFIAGRARVRQVLSRYVGRPPHELDVVARVDGRPALPGAPSWFDFSFSRCAGLHVCVVAVRRRIGVDVEVIDAHTDAEVWTKRQALAKAADLDIDRWRDNVALPAAAGETVTLESYGTRSWLVRSFRPEPGIVGAVAGEGDWRMTLWRYPPPPGLPGR